MIVFIYATIKSTTLRSKTGPALHGLAFTDLRLQGLSKLGYLDLRKEQRGSGA